ncbi:MAG: carbamoyl phosphate synthase large subunit, partial [Archaeoglobaceae archaeon]
PLSGNILISVKDADKPKTLGVAKKFAELGFKIYATEKTAKFLREHGIEAEIAFKVSQGRPNIVDMIINGQIDLIINTPSGKTGKTEGYEIRRTAVEYGVPYITTIPGAIAAAKAIEAVKKGKLVVKSINEYHEEVRRLS